MSHILTVNAGSSSLKYALYRAKAEPVVLAQGKVGRIGGAAQLTPAGGPARDLPPGTDHAGALAAVLAELSESHPDAQVTVVGHRVVHGGPDYAAPVELTPKVIAQLEGFAPYAPLHQPHNLAGVRAAMAAFPQARQIACFDTAFHRGHPFVNDTFALPRRFYDKGVRRYGFHGLSYDYIAGEVARRAPALSRVVVAHLGNGASMCALRDGRSVASTMGFSALDGLPMGTRCGQLDPGVVLYLMQQEGMDADQISDLLYTESGLKGMSGLSNDMRELQASDDPRAVEALDYFVFRIRRELGAMAAVLGGIDGLVFCGGIGENSAPVRARVCAGMDWLGIAVSDTANDANAPVISTGPVQVMVIPTNEEIVIARAAVALADA
ncbi:acetate/propionate family kinase [Pseudooceanicola onchidii]|uniref:acetate/propionate family kinase n=1 Tax=Pseudooceanicola onchidii TaxID=2562279 RepID=UPI0010A9C271|nr:acetate/propionate family kinase [Pseudooceanicola onchidii]